MFYPVICTFSGIKLQCTRNRLIHHENTATKKRQCQMKTPQLIHKTQQRGQTKIIKKTPKSNNGERPMTNKNQQITKQTKNN